MQPQQSNITDIKKPLRKNRLGESLIDSGLITSEQLDEALKIQRQEQGGKPLGWILIETGFISIDDLLNHLSKHSGVPVINLFTINVPSEVIQRMPLELIKTIKAVPISISGNILTLAMANPHDFMAISDLEFRLGIKVKPMVAPSFMVNTAIKILSTNYEDGLNGELVKAMMSNDTGTEVIPDIKVLLKQLVKSGASDMLLIAGVPPTVKLSNELKRLAYITLRPMDCEKYAKQILSEKEWEKFSSLNELDCAYTYPGIGRFRINVYRQRQSVAIAIRNLREDVPTIEQLCIPTWITSHVLRTHGLILVCGPSGHGKSTTVCAMVNAINESKRCNIISLEDPVEYLFAHKKSNVSQREVGRDTESFAEGLRHIFRQAPDVIVIGELRDRESYEIAIHAANTGHLVISTVHADNSTSVIERIINMFPSYQQPLIRITLADSLILCISQRLVPNKKKTGRIVAVECLVNSYRMKNLIRDGKTNQIRTQIQVGADDFIPLDMSLAELFKAGEIDYDDGLLFSIDEQVYRQLCGVTIKK